jgi:hypothetical protein
MKLRIALAALLVAVSSAACSQSPTAPQTRPSAVQSHDGTTTPPDSSALRDNGFGMGGGN